MERDSERMVMMHFLFILLALLLAGCAAGPRIPLDLGTNPPAWYGMNISTDDLLDPTTAASRLEIYLDELTTAGYAKEIRIILTPDWGPQIYRDWFPVIRAKGFKVLAILSQEKRDSADMPEQAQAWARYILPLIKDDLIGVQISNEQWGWFTPIAYIAWHKVMAPIIRELTNDVPIVVGDITVIDSQYAHWEQVARELTVGQDYDIVSLHLTDTSKEEDLRVLVQRLNRLHGPTQHYWITEGDWGHFPWMMSHGLMVDKEQVYAWNTKDGHAQRLWGTLP